MPTKGKPNTFFKGMKSDLEKSMQSKDSYRYAKNARVTSLDGDNVSVQPYPSDRLALTFRGESSFVNGLQTLSYTPAWTAAASQLSTIADALTLGGNEWPPSLAEFEDLWGPIEIPGDFTEFIAGNDNPVSVTIVLETIDGNTIEITEDITNAYLLTNQMNVPFDVDNVVVGIINESQNGILVTATVNGDIGNSQTTTNWVFINTEDSSDYVSSFSVTVSGTGSYSVANQDLIEQALIASLPPIDNDFAEALVTVTVGFIFDNITDYYNTLSQTPINSTVINDVELQVNGLSIFEQFAENIGFSPNQPGIQVLGTYSFSDQLIILAKWPLMGALQAEAGSPIACDMVIKVRQAADGTLNGNGLDGFGDFIPFDELGTLYTIYFTGNLEFTLGKKIKITGSEESGKTRRIYFTDGLFPLKTMNVGLDPILYTPYFNTPEYFNIFAPAVFAPTKVTGFLEGGNLSSKAYSYGFKYKTVDGRTSKLSPLSNPASLPKTASSVEGPFVKGAKSEDSTGKTMTGEIRNLDTRYAKIQLIFVPYENNAPAGPGIIFNEYPVPAVNDNNDENVIFWSHTGTEQPIGEVPLAELNDNQVSWDTCQALETKDNRLFVGNLSNSVESIDTDFRVISYNKENQPHNVETGNPHLYNDLLYSTAGVVISNEFTLPVQPSLPGAYLDEYLPENGDYVSMFRYIKGPTNNSALYNGELLGVQQQRGIFGAQSNGFDQPNEDGEIEGIRVTFRILSEESSGGTFPIDLDRDSRLIQSSGVKALPPYYNLPAGQNNYYNNYSNPLYNSNYVGYRRGEIYRFGLLFYDKLGAPMFIKPIGDIRMPEHSAEYVTPIYDPTSENGQITGFQHEWPYYYQTARSVKDRGFQGIGDYINKEGVKGCVLYPYFEVRLSSATTSKIGGYSVVRVPRDSINKSIVTSGIFSRAISYKDDSFGSDLEGKLGNSTFPLWTELRQKQDYRRFNGEGDRASRVYTLDSPDVCSDGDFVYNFSSSDRIKLTESGFCLKQNVRLEDANGETNTEGLQKMLSIDLADNQYNPLDVNQILPAYILQPKSLNLFTSVVSKDKLQDSPVQFNEEDYNTGTWNYRFSSEAQNFYDFEDSGIFQNILGQDTNAGEFNFNSNTDLVSNDDDVEKHVGYFTKYYSKRISCYPQYVMRDTTVGTGGEFNNSVGTGVGFNIGNQQQALRLPYINLSNPDSPDSFSINNPSAENYFTNNNGDTLEPGQFFETKIHYAQILNPEQEINSGNIPGDSPSFRNAHHFHELYPPTQENFDKRQANDQNNQNDYFKKASRAYALNSKTIGIVLEKPGGMPVVRQNLAVDNFSEGIVRRIGVPKDNQGNPGGNFSPEVTIASIVRAQSKETMYGGFTEGDFSRNIFQSTGQFRPVVINSQNPGQSLAQNNTGENGNAVFGGDTYVGYHKLKKTFKPSSGANGEDESCVLFASMVPLETDFNLELRHGWNFSNNSDSIPRFIEDEYLYNESFDSQNNGLAFKTKPIDFEEVSHWPSMIAFSEQKIPGEVDDNYSIFPVNQIKDLDYEKGPITQMFMLSNEMYALQYYGTSKLSINPRVLIQAEDGNAIQAQTGTDNILERYDYISEVYGSQHFHGLAVSDKAAYFYDDDNCKFLRLGLGEKGKFGIMSLGENSFMQNYFNQNKNRTLNDNPLTIRTYTNEALPPSENYDINKLLIYQGIQEEDLGGVSIGFDPEHSEVLLTTMFNDKGVYLAPETIVFNENLGAFTSFVSKTAGHYFNHHGRLYNVYNKYSSNDNSVNSLNNGLDEIYMSNGYEEFPNASLPTFPAKFLNFGDVDYYIWESEVQGQSVVPIYKEPFEIEMVINDAPIESKIFDKIQLSMNSETLDGTRYIYFRKFAFEGSANTAPITQNDTNILGENYSSIDNLEPGGNRNWYTVRDNLHFAPMRSLNGLESQQGGKTRGTYATVRMTMGWAIDNEHPSGYDRIKNEKFNIFSAVPFFRASRI